MPLVQQAGLFKLNNNQLQPLPQTQAKFNTTSPRVQLWACHFCFNALPHSQGNCRMSQVTLAAAPPGHQWGGRGQGTRAPACCPPVLHIAVSQPPPVWAETPVPISPGCQHPLFMSSVRSWSNPQTALQNTIFLLFSWGGMELRENKVSELCWHRHYGKCN